MYKVEILVNNDSNYNAIFSFLELENAKSFIAIVISEGYEAKVWFKDEDESE